MDKMKKIYKYFILAAAAIASAACTNLDEEIYSEIPKDKFFTSESQLIIYTARAYQTVQNWGTEQSLYTLNLQLADEVCVPGNSVGEWTQARYKELQSHDITQANKLVRQGWNYIFDGIAACNDVIYEIEHAEAQFNGKENILAEIKVLRAFYYMWGIDLFGNIPYSVSKEETEYPEQKDRAFIFDFVEKEIKENLALLQDEPTAAYYGRVTKGMANTLLAKMYLNAEVWIGKKMYAEAEAACKAVIDSKHYSLEDKFETNFSTANEGSKEQIFAIPYSTIYTTSSDNAFNLFIMTLSPDECKAFNIPTGGWDGFVAQPDHFQSFETGDKRRDLTWLHGQLKDYKGVPVEGYVINPVLTDADYTKRANPSDGAKLAKWAYQNDGLLKSDGTSMDNDFFIFRYADVVLMYAEAALRQGKDVSLVKDDLAKIRTRAGLEDITWDLEAVYNERCHELAIEGWKRQDLIRFGKYLDPWYAKPAGQNFMLLLPIPTEVLNTNTKLTQNQGYTK